MENHQMTGVWRFIMIITLTWQICFIASRTARGHSLRNKRFLKSQMEQEENPVIRRLLEQDQTHLDRIQVQMATAREFLIMLRLKDEKESDIFPYLSRIEKSLKEQSFSVKRADKEDIKRILAVYYEQNVTTEKFEDFDGERWIIPEI